MSRIVLSAALPAPLAERVRTIAGREDRTVSYTLGKLLEQSLENDNGAPPQDAEVKTGAGTPDESAE